MSWSLLATVVASRRGASGRLQFAKIHQEHCSLHENEPPDFDLTEMPLLAGSNPALNFIKYRADAMELWTDPCFALNYTGPCTVEGRFKWHTINDSDPMTEQEARCCLEHYAAWSE